MVWERFFNDIPFEMTLIKPFSNELSPATEQYAGLIKNK